MTIGSEMKKTLVHWKSDNNNPKKNNNNVRSVWGPVSGSNNHVPWDIILFIFYLVSG